ncbi:MAG: cobalamin-independent methionine synthase II family protein [Solirubrobacterales bacterium]|nr:cobalamin-independent methionine synthase II family protein [Solirubrobacterales bacterium]MBV9714344.1 cobalamin-independent methionine synthase II family protein [Solirubrobacterales bacterium]
MKRSVEHILTTHTGSLPRPPALTQALQRRDRGEPEGAGLEQQVRDAVADVVQHQADAGVSVVNDGEASKIGYSTYVKERLEGFGGEGGLPGLPADLTEFPDYMQRIMGGLDFELPACVGPVSYRDLDAVRTDISNLKAAVADAEVEDAFMTAASPGVISVFLQNQHYPSHEEYIAALADVMKAEYDEIHGAGLVLQLDCPDLAMTRHMRRDESLEDFRRRAKLHVEAINHATRDIPGDEMRIHLCWGNYEGPHNHDVPLREIIDIVFEARPAAISFEAANPRHEHEWTVFEDVKLPDGKALIPGVLDSTTNYVEHPELVAQRIIRYAQLVGRENVIAGSDCGFATFASFLAVDPAITWAKLGAMAEGARLASAQLW